MDYGLQELKGQGSLEICGQQNVRDSARDNTAQNTSSPRIKIKIPDPVKDETWAAGLEGMDSTNLAMVKDTESSYLKIFQHKFNVSQYWKLYL